MDPLHPTKQVPADFKTSSDDLTRLLEQRDEIEGIYQDLLDFSYEHPETVGMVKRGDSFEFDEGTLRKILKKYTGMYNEKEAKKINKTLFSCLMKNPLCDQKAIVKIFFQESEWEFIAKIPSSLISEQEELIKDQIREHKNAFPENLLCSIIVSNPEINWLQLSFDLLIHGKGKAVDLALYFIVKSLDDKEYSNYTFTIENRNLLQDLFHKVHDALYDIVSSDVPFKKLPRNLKQVIADDVIISQHPVLAGAVPELHQMLEVYCNNNQELKAKKIAQMAFRGYRHNNGLWDKKYTKSQIKDVTDMIVEGLLKHHVTYDAALRQVIVTEIGKDQNLKRPVLKQADIDNIVSQAIEERKKGQYRPKICMNNIIISPVLAWSELVTWHKPDPQETIFLVMRHGETFGNKASDETSYTYTGCHTNFPLNEMGVSQVEGVANRIGDLYTNKALEISAIYSSPLWRAVQTAAPIAEVLGLPVEVRPSLREIDWGIADGKLVKEIDDIWDEQERAIDSRTDFSRKQKWDLFPIIPEAEKFNQVLSRVLPELEKIAEKHEGEVVLISTHGRVVKCLTAEALDQDDSSVPYPKNAGIVVFRYVKGGPLQFIEVRDNQ